MARFGFIRDKLEIKFLILYLLTRVAAPIDFSGLTDLALCDEGIDYFEYAEAVSELLETGHLTLEGGRYAVTEKGRRNGAACETSLPYSVRVKCDRNLVKVNHLLRRGAQVRAEVLSRADGAFTLRLALDDETDNLLSLELLVATEAQAELLAERFRTYPEKVYQSVLDALLTDFSLAKD